jgi:Flp pilus assembly pilin Flp
MVMNRLRQWLKTFLRGELGAEQTQFAIIAALIVIAVVAGVRFLGNAASNKNNSTSTMLQNATPAGPSSS